MKTDILFLCQFFYPEYNSSATLPFDTARFLAENGLRVSALCGYPKEYSQAGRVPAKECADGVSIRRIRYIELDRKRKLGRLINYFSFTLAALAHIRSLKDCGCVVVYSNPPVLPIVPIVANTLYKTKFIFVAYDVYPEVAYASGTLEPGGLIDKVMRGINSRLYRRCAAAVALTDEMREFLLENRPELSADRVFTIPNWAHEKVLTPDRSAYERFGYRNGQFIVSYFGNMGTCQDVETMLGAAERLKGSDAVRFLIVGHGNKKAQVGQRIAEKKLDNVRLLDFLTGRDFEQAVAVSSCCIVSLEKGLMGTCAPSKYYSYLQGGLPVLAVVEKDSYLAREVKREGIGLAVEVGDVDGLEKAIELLSCSPELCAGMGEKARNLYLREYDYPLGMEKYRRLVEAVTEDSSV